MVGEPTRPARYSGRPKFNNRTGVKFSIRVCHLLSVITSAITGLRQAILHFKTRGPRLRVQRIVITRLLALGSIFQFREAQATFYRQAPIVQRYYC